MFYNISLISLSFGKLPPRYIQSLLIIYCHTCNGTINFSTCMLLLQAIPVDKICGACNISGKGYILFDKSYCTITKPFEIQLK